MDQRQGMDGLQRLIADAVAEGTRTAHMNKTPSDMEAEHPDIGPMQPTSLFDARDRRNG